MSELSGFKRIYVSRSEQNVRFYQGKQWVLFSTVLIVFFNAFSEKKTFLDIIVIDPYVKHCWLNWL